LQLLEAEEEGLRRDPLKQQKKLRDSINAGGEREYNVGNFTGTLYR
jgi:hypothetical protein